MENRIVFIGRGYQRLCKVVGAKVGNWEDGVDLRAEPTEAITVFVDRFKIMSDSVLIVHDHLVLRQALELLLKSSGVEVTASTGDYENTLELVAELSPGVALIDFNLFSIKTEQIVSELVGLDGELGILLFCDRIVPEQLERCIDSGAGGCVSKDSSLEKLLEAIAAVAGGESFYDQKVGAALAGSGTGSPKRLLTGREIEVLQLLSKGYSGVETAKQLWLSPETVRTHIRNAMSKLGAKTRVHAIVLAMISGQLDMND